MSSFGKNPRVIRIRRREVGPGHPVYIVAELSANHRGDYASAERIVRAAKEAGADAVKLQTYTADTITLASRKKPFLIGGGTLWDGKTLHDLYSEAFTPWEWQPRLKKLADKLGLDLFSSAFDATAVDFLEKMKVPAHKVASCEIVDIPLIEKMARTLKPIVISTGMATRAEIAAAIGAARRAGARQIALLKCTSAYPAEACEMNLKTIPDMARTFKVPVGLSDHMLGHTAAVAAVTLGACIVEKHLTLSRKVPGPDSAFSLEPDEFKALVQAVRACEAVLGRVQYGPSERERASRAFRRSLFIVRDVKAGEKLTVDNVRSIRPAHGLPPVDLKRVLGKRASRDLETGTPLSWELIR